MVQNLKFKIIFIIAVLLGAAFVIYTKDITLGLDLSGGSSLRYKLPPTELGQGQTNQDVLNSTLDVFRKRIQGSGLKEIPIRGMGEDEILLELPDMTEVQVNNIVDIIQSQGNLEWMISVEGTETDETDDSVTVDEAEEQKKLVAFLQKLEANGGWDLNVDLSPLNFEKTINDKQAFYRWAPYTDESLEKSEFSREIPPPGSTFESLGLNPEAGPGQAGSIGQYFSLLKRFADPKWQFRGSDLASVSPSQDQNGNPSVGFTLKAARSSDFKEFTRVHTQKKMAIVLDGRVDSEPVIQGELPGSGIISGPQPKGFTLTEQKKLLTLLRSGSLVVKPVLLSKNTIGPTLGENSIYRGKIAAAIGLSAVFIFMVVYYLFAGLIAAVALAVNLTLLFGFLVFMEATLTLPGIAGIVLTVGMAVDANILIFERIREEKDKGKTLPQSVKNGFERAFITIVDANVTTFLTGFILFQFGTGPIKGFAWTLMAGICSSLFAALFVSKVIFAGLLEKGWLKKLNMLRLLKSPDIAFPKAMPFAGAVSIFIIIAGLVGFFMVDESKYGLDFTGGYHIRIKCNEDTTQQQVQTELGAEFPNVQVVSVTPAIGKPEYQEFDIKIKSTLSDEEALRLEQEALKASGAAEEGKAEAAIPATESGIGSSEYYLERLKVLLGDALLKDPIFDLKLTPDPSTQSVAVSFALNLERPVDRPAVEEALTGLMNIQNVEFSENRKTVQVSGVYTRDINIRPTQLEGRIITQVKSAEEAGSPVMLLDPYPMTDYIGPTVGHQLRDSAIIAIFFSLVAIIIYIRLRFKEYKYGFSAAVALIHDVLITLGAVTVARASGLVDVEIDLPLIAAFLTIIGYSLNDTIVVFDRVRENLPRIELPFVDLLNLSINQTLARTVLTSLTTLLTLVILFVLNYGQRNVMEGFSFALIVGVVVGTYSSIFVASPVLILLHRREQRAASAK